VHLLPQGLDPLKYSRSFLLVILSSFILSAYYFSSLLVVHNPFLMYLVSVLLLSFFLATHVSLLKCTLDSDIQHNFALFLSVWEVSYFEGKGKGSDVPVSFLFN